MNATFLLLRATVSLDVRAAIRRAALAGLGLALAACGGSADAPPPPETVPTVLTQPADQSVVVGGAAAFSVGAAGAAPLAYQLGEQSGRSDLHRHCGRHGQQLRHRSDGAEPERENGLSSVVVSNSLGSVTSSAAQLTVTPALVAPAITVQPADQTVTAPATATFSVTATGTTPAYEWQSSSDGGATFAPVAGGPERPRWPSPTQPPAQSGNAIGCGSATPPAASPATPPC